MGAEHMGTHPIFESDFDCLTDKRLTHLFCSGIKSVRRDGKNVVRTQEGGNPAGGGSQGRGQGQLFGGIRRRRYGIRSLRLKTKMEIGSYRQFCACNTCHVKKHRSCHPVVKRSQKKKVLALIPLL